MKCKLLTLTLGLLAISVLASAGRADSLDVTLTQATQTVVLGTTTVAFDATISNPSSTDNVYLNGDTSYTSSLLVSVDDSPFLANAPLFLDPGQSTGSVPFVLFDVLLDPILSAGTYTGVFSILGGPDGGTFSDFDDLADADFTVNIVNPTPTPEPSGLLLLGSGLASLGLLRKKIKFLS